MSNRYIRLSRAFLIAAFLTLPLAQGCAAKQDPRITAAVEDKSFQDWFDQLIGQIKANPQYKRIPIETEAQQNEFLALLHDAYRHRISKQEFAQRVNSQYPNHQSETSFIVSKLP